MILRIPLDGGLAMAKESDRFAVLRAEFEATGNRLKQTNDVDERQCLLRELRQMISEMDMLLEESIGESQKSDLIQ
jgi:hypothetical protein